MQEDTFNLTDFHCGKGKNIEVYYKGPFDKGLLDIIGTNIRKTISKNAASGTKLFRLFIELAQNISHYSAERFKTVRSKGPGVGSLVLINCRDHYQFITGNLIKNEHLEKVMDRCREINSMDRDRLRKLKRERLASIKPGREGADIGLIQLAIISENPLEVKSVPVDGNNSFITITVKLNK